MKMGNCIRNAFILFSSIAAIAEGFECNVETICAKKIENDQKYEVIAGLDRGQHKTILRFENLPEDQDVILTVQRPLFPDGRGDQSFKTNKSKLSEDGHLFGEDKPLFMISGRGFFPGEKVRFLCMSYPNNQGRQPSESATVELIPNPLTFQDVDGAVISAELDMINPTSYTLTMDRFKPYEKLQFASVSGGERMRHPITYEKKIVMGYMPGVLGQKGGKAQLSIIRQNGTIMKLIMPWGENLLLYLKGDSAAPVLDFPTIKG